MFLDHHELDDEGHEGRADAGSHGCCSRCRCAEQDGAREEDEQQANADDVDRNKRQIDPVETARDAFLDMLQRHQRDTDQHQIERPDVMAFDALSEEVDTGDPG